MRGGGRTRSRKRKASSWIVIVGASFIAANAAAAPDSPTNPNKQACIDAATRGQIQRDDGKLSSAAEAFAICSASTCPVGVRKHCAEWLADAKQKMPRVTVQLDPSEQADPASANATKVQIDGNAATLGTAIELDPGRHSVTIERPNKPTLTENFTLAASENKTVVVRPPAPPVSEPKKEPITSRPIPLSVIVLGGVAVVGFASWGIFGLLAKSDTDRMLEECAPGCPESDKDAALTKAIVADISLGVGALATIGAGVLFFTRPTITHAEPSEGAPAPRDQARPRMTIAPAIGLGRFGVSGTF